MIRLSGCIVSGCIFARFGSLDTGPRSEKARKITRDPIVSQFTVCLRLLSARISIRLTTAVDKRKITAVILIARYFSRFPSSHRAVVQLVERTVRDREVVGSSPASPIKRFRKGAFLSYQMSTMLKNVLCCVFHVS